MLLDSLNVRLPGDPSSNKLMMSLLDCLPKVNQVGLVCVSFDCVILIAVSSAVMVEYWSIQCCDVAGADMGFAEG